LGLDEPWATQAVLAEYLSLVDRPVLAMLAAERCERRAPGAFTYRSRPYPLLGWSLTPTLDLEARWHQGALEIRSSQCRIEGLGAWRDRVVFGMEALLRPQDGLIRAETHLWLQTPAARFAWSRRLADRALEQVLARLESRFQRGLPRDCCRWSTYATVVP